MANNNAGLDLQDYHDGALMLAEQVRAAERTAKAAKDVYDDAMDALVKFTAEDDAPETSLLDD